MKKIPIEPNVDYYKHALPTYKHNITSYGKWLEGLELLYTYIHNNDENPDMLLMNLGGIPLLRESPSIQYSKIISSSIPINTLIKLSLKNLKAEIDIKNIKKNYYFFLDLVVYHSAKVTGAMSPIFYIIEYLDNKKDTILYHVFDVFSKDFSSWKIQLSDVYKNTYELLYLAEKDLLKYFTQYTTKSDNQYIKYLIENYGFKFNTESIESQIFSTVL